MFDVGDNLERLREVCLSLPETTEKLSHGAPSFFVKGKQFVMLLNDHHGDGKLALWCAALKDVQQSLSEEGPDWFFVPPYVGHRGWIGIRLDRGLEWDEVSELVQDGYRAVAPPKIVALAFGE